MNNFLLIGAGAVLGANARYFVALWAATRWGVNFPYGTLLVNITGSLILGFLLAAGGERLYITPEVRLLVAIGFLGSYTTFSSYTVESLLLFQDGNLWRALLNIVGNNLLGLGSAILGILLARLLG